MKLFDKEFVYFMWDKVLGEREFLELKKEYELKKAYYAEHKQIQFKSLANGKWIDCVGEPLWGEAYDYRVKPGEPEQPKRMTYRQLAEWLAKGNGQCRYKDMILSSDAYQIKDDNKEIDECYKIRRWDSDEWIEPTVGVYKEDCGTAMKHGLPMTT